MDGLSDAKSYLFVLCVLVLPLTRSPRHSNHQSESTMRKCERMSNQLVEKVETNGTFFKSSTHRFDLEDTATFCHCKMRVHTLD